MRLFGFFLLTIFGINNVLSDSIAEFSYKDIKHGLGFSIGSTLGNGISYSNSITDNMAIHVVGMIYGESDKYLTYNGGLGMKFFLGVYDRVRFFVEPSIAGKQVIDLVTGDKPVIKPITYSTWRESEQTSIYDSVFVVISYNNRQATIGTTLGVEYLVWKFGLSFCAGYQFSVSKQKEFQIEPDSYYNDYYYNSYYYAGANYKGYKSRSDAENAPIKTKFKSGFTGDVSLHFYF